MKIIVGLASETQLKPSFQVEAVVKSLMPEDGQVEIVDFFGQLSLGKYIIEIRVPNGVGRHALRAQFAFTCTPVLR